ncbi:MAG: S41 family peptidase [Phycisphaerales bacterium]
MNRIGVRCVGLAIACLCLSCRSSQGTSVAAGFRGPINAVGSSSPSTVLIVPTNESDKTAQQQIHAYVEAVRKFILEKDPERGVKVLTDSEALADGLSHSAISVYGTPQGNLWLAKYMRQLPVVIEPNRITTDRVHEGSDLRFISAWPHPSNPGLGMVILTAQRAQDVVGINGVFHGPTDFVVARGQTIVQSGSYFNKGGAWSFGGGLSLPQATEDLEFLFTTIEQVHPAPWANLSKDQHRQLKADSQAALAKACEDKGCVPRVVLATTAAKAAASIGDGHTSCWIGSDLSDADDSSPCMPPFRLQWQGGQVVIADTIPGLEHLKDACLVEIGGKPVAEAIAPILDRISGERQAFRMIGFLENQQAHWALARPVQGEEMTITVRRGDGDPQVVKAPLISLARYRDELPAIREVNSAFRHEFHHDGRTCYWRYDGFQVSDAAKKAIDGVFKDLREHGARNLVIDLRFNGGGNSQAAEYILDYLTSERYCLYSRVDVKVSKQFLATQRLGIVGPLSRLALGRVVTAKQSPRRPRDMGYRFDGSLYVITGPGTFSTASDFSHVVKDYHLGTLVGDETGGLRQCFGDCPSFRMPHSDLQFTVSTKRFYAPIPAPDDATHGSVPDIPIDESSLAPFLNSPDPELACVLNLVARRDSRP